MVDRPVSLGSHIYILWWSGVVSELSWNVLFCNRSLRSSGASCLWSTTSAESTACRVRCWFMCTNIWSSTIRGDTMDRRAAKYSGICGRSWTGKLKGLQYINIKLMLCYHFRMSTWKAVLMAPGMRDATSHVHMAEVFSVPIATSYQTVGLTPVETCLEQLQQRTVRSNNQWSAISLVPSISSWVMGMRPICTLLKYSCYIMHVILLFCSSYWVPTEWASWPDNWVQPDGEILRKWTRDTGPPEFLLPRCNSVWPVCSEWCLWFHVLWRSKGWSWERDWKYSLEGNRQSTSKVSSMTRLLFIFTAAQSMFGLWTQEWSCTIRVCDETEEQTWGAC